jgi:RNA polymerase sigma-70 factor (ECF subfamily)
MKATDARFRDRSQEIVMQESDPARTGPSADQHERFLLLFTKHQREIYTYIAAVLADWSDVDEVMQRTSLALWRRFDTFLTGGNFAAWACGVAHREVLMLRRAKGRDRHVYGAAYEDAALVAADYVAGLDDRREALAACLEKLPPADRSLVEVCYTGPGGVKQAAESLGRSAKSVYKALARVRQMLLTCIERKLQAEGSVP